VLPEALEGVPIRQALQPSQSSKHARGRLDGVADEAISQGVRLVSWGVDPATNSGGVGVASEPREAQEILTDLVGDDVPITVRAEAPVTT
jgi:hypothetical protein